MVKKRKFRFEPMEGLVDVYLDGKKVRAEHNGETGHIYFPILDPFLNIGHLDILLFDLLFQIFIFLF